MGEAPEAAAMTELAAQGSTASSSRGVAARIAAAREWLRRCGRSLMRLLSPGEQFSILAFEPDDPSKGAPALLGSGFNLSPLGRVLVRDVLTSGAIQVVDYRQADPEARALAEEHDLGVVVGVPIQVRGQTVGVASFVLARNRVEANATGQAALERLRQAGAIVRETPAQTASGRVHVNQELIGGPRLAAETPTGQPLGAPSRPMADLISAIVGEAVGRLDAEFDRAEEMTEANQAKSEFISVISHELRSPLTYVFGFSEMIANRGVPEDQVPRVAQRIHSEAERMLQMVDELLDITKMEMGKQVLTLEPTALASLIDDVTSGVKLTTDRHQIVFDCPADLTVLGDPARLRQVLVNLLNNAVRYSPEGGEVRVQVDSVQEPGAGGTPTPIARIAVIDQGIGIPEAEQARVFEKFHRVDSDLKRRVRGSGLGLSICQAIVQEHHGRIWVESEVGKGSRFIFTVPLATARTSEAAQPPELVSVD